MQRISPIDPIEGIVATTPSPQRSGERPSTESDTSEHSYHLQVATRRSQDSAGSGGSLHRSSSPFATPEVQATPIPRSSCERSRSAGYAQRDSNSLATVDERAASGPDERPPTPQRAQSAGTKHRRMAAFRDYRQQIGTRSAFSMELPPTDVAQLRRGVRVSFDMPPTTANARDELPIARELVGRIVRRRRRLPLPWVIGFGIVSSAALCVGLTTLSIGLYNFTKLRANRAQKSIADLEADLLPEFKNINASLAAVQVGLDLIAGGLGRRAGP